MNNKPAILLPANLTERNVPALDAPAMVREAGPAARFAWDEFFYGELRNPHTRRAYLRVVKDFLAQCEARRLALLEVTPRDVGQYLDQHRGAAASKKLALSALRHFFDRLVTRHVVILNPAGAVRGPRLEVIEGKTPEITVEQARRLMATVRTTDVVGLRDRAILGTLIYTAARVGAVAQLRHRDLIDGGDQYLLRFQEKGGKAREIPMRHDLRGFVFEYLQRAGNVQGESQVPIFLTAVGRTKRLTARGMTAEEMGRMVKRRMRDAGLPARLCPHSFRVATITNLLEQGVPLEDVQRLAGHADPRTTRLYDRRQQQITRNIVERISI